MGLELGDGKLAYRPDTQTVYRGFVLAVPLWMQGVICQVFSRLAAKADAFIALEQKEVLARADTFLPYLHEAQGLKVWP